MLKGEKKIRIVLDELRERMSKELADPRVCQARRRLELLKKRRNELSKIQHRAVSLMAKVNYADFKPRFIVVAPKDRQVWNYCRNCVSSAPYNLRPGRKIFYLVIDEISGGIVGFFELAGELMALAVRDRYVGWDTKTKLKKGRRINHSANIGTCVGIHPFGILTGGKFMILTALSNFFALHWEHRYGDKLAMITTTSLYGKASQYNRIKDFHYAGCSAGIGTFQIDDRLWSKMRNFAHANSLIMRQSLAYHSIENRWDVMNRICAALKIDRATQGEKNIRGVYVGFLGDEAQEYMQGKRDDFTVTDKTADEAREFWMNRWYSMRWPKKKDEVRDFDYRVYNVDKQIERAEKMSVPQGGSGKN